MNNDYRLLQEALDTFNKLRHWTDPDYYREQVMPTVRKIKDRLALIETEKFLNDRKKQYEEFKSPIKIDKPPPFEVKFAEPEDLDTVPNKLVEATSNFGLFSEEPISDRCKKDPRAPHRYLKELSINLGRPVCECEFWEPKD